MIKIAITGNIAAGKGVAEDFFRQSDFAVYDTDIIAHDILEQSSEVSNLFNNQNIYTDGKLDRKKIGKIVFSDRDKLNELEKLIHPQVKEKILELFEKHKLDTFIFVSVPQLFESGFDKLFDKIIFISADKNIRLQRLMKRNSLSLDEAIVRINNQIDEQGKISKSDYVVYNDGSKEDYIAKLQQLLANISQITS